VRERDVCREEKKKKTGDDGEKQRTNKVQGEIWLATSPFGCEAQARMEKPNPLPYQFSQTQVESSSSSASGGFLGVLGVLGVP